MGSSKGNRKAEQPTFFDKSTKWLKYNETKENLFGTQGLFSPHDTVVPQIPIAGNKDSVIYITMPTQSPKSINNQVVPKNEAPRLKHVRDTILITQIDTVYIQDNYKDGKYSYHIDNLHEGQTFVDPLTNSTVSIFNIQPDFTASAIMDYPNGFHTLYFEKPPPVKVRPGDSWTNVRYEHKTYKLTITNINYLSKIFSINISETN